jgi:4-alpha-glucanotransferase
MMISPDLLARDGFINEGELKQNTYYFTNNKVDFSESSAYKQFIFKKAFQQFKQGVDKDFHRRYEAFCHEHDFWLQDYARFVAIKEYHQGVDWGRWNSDLRDKEGEAISRIDIQLSAAIEQEKFLQFVFFEQWGRLKKYCNEKNVSFIGDLPFYVSYDSADVWANPEVFYLNDEKRPTVVSGVPPDYFSKTGQLWGTPIFNWSLMKERGYEWWYKRIGQNLKWCDMIRLDHFRAFSAYWEVPAHHKTAIDGHWVEGPGNHIFDVFKDKFPDLPIIAEDLGTIDDEVRNLMQDYNLPGMKVLLFAFGPGMPQNPYILHNHVKDCVAYTGTHDNNTVVGWWRNEADEESKKNLQQYLGRDIKTENVHDVLVSMVMMSVASIAIFPLQDLLGLGEEAIMNRPGTVKDNWCWRYTADQINDELTEKVKNWVTLYGRD